MNTVGVILSASCLMVALIELRLRSDLAGRRMAAILASAAWVTMGFVALDQNRQCKVMLRAQAAVIVPATQMIADAVSDTRQRQSPAQAQAQISEAQSTHNMISSRTQTHARVGAGPD